MPIEFILEHDVIWTAKTHLPQWAGYQDRTGAYGGLNSDTSSDGTVNIMLVSDAQNPEPPDAEYLALVDRILDDGPQISRAVQLALWTAYPVIRDGYTEMYGEEPGDLMPPLSSPEDLRSVLGLHTLHIHGIEANGVPYVGYEFGCTWEDEHGLGMLMHGATLADLGHADTAMTLWMATAHAETQGFEITGPMADLAMS